MTCLTKVAENQTYTERYDNSILFNTSKIVLDGSVLNLSVKEREVVFVGSSEKIKLDESVGYKPIYDVKVNWVECFKNVELDLKLKHNVTDILVITKEIYDNLIENGMSDEEIYTSFKKKGLGQMSLELSNVTDFSALTAQVLLED
jgi:hypothetical protein